MSRIYDCSDSGQLLTGIRLASAAISRGEVIVIPTDTVYGVAVDAFNPTAVQALLNAKGRDRSSPPPVLIPGLPTMDALAREVPSLVRELVGALWPGGLTVILRAQPSLSWDLGDTAGTVALRMPNNELALQLLAETGPLAVSSANLSGMPAATDAASAELMLGSAVQIYLNGGPVGDVYEAIGERPGDTSSTIVDATRLNEPGGKLYIVRQGVVSREAIKAIAGDTLAGADELPRSVAVNPDGAEPPSAEPATAEPASAEPAFVEPVFAEPAFLQPAAPDDEDTDA